MANFIKSKKTIKGVISMTINYDAHVNDSLGFIMSVAKQVTNHSHDITLSYEENKDWTEIIDVPHISYLDYFYLKKSFDNVSNDEMESFDLFKLDFQIYEKEEISAVELHEVDAGPYISGSSGVSGNCYSSDCDTYGNYYYSMYFLYQPEIEKYITVECRAYAC